MSKLQPPKNVRETNHKCCGSCAHLKSTEDDFSNPYSPIYSTLYCERMGEEFELPCEAENINLTVCDRFKSFKNRGKA